MSCAKFERRLQQLLDRRRPIGGDSRLLAHTLACATCRDSLAAAELLTELVAGAPTAEEEAAEESAAKAPLRSHGRSQVNLFTANLFTETPSAETPLTHNPSVNRSLAEVVVATHGRHVHRNERRRLTRGLVAFALAASLAGVLAVGYFGRGDIHSPKPLALVTQPIRVSNARPLPGEGLQAASVNRQTTARRGSTSTAAVQASPSVSLTMLDLSQLGLDESGNLQASWLAPVANSLRPLTASVTEAVNLLLHGPADPNRPQNAS